MKLVAAIAFVFLVFLSPPFMVSPGLPFLRGEDVIISVFLMCLCLQPRSCLRQLPAGQKDKVTIAFAIMLAVALLSICVSGLQKTIILNDFMILPMLVRYWLIYKFAQLVCTPGARRIVLCALAVSVGVSALIGIMQAHDIGGMSGRITALYLPGPVQEELLERIRAAEESGIESRIGGTNGDARHYGYLLVAGIAVCASIYLYTTQKRGRVMALCAAPLCLIALIYTMSRTPVLCAVIIAIVAMGVYQRTRGMEAKTLVLWLLFVALGAGVFLGFLTGAAKERLFRSDTDSFQSSARARKRDFITPFSMALEDPAMILIGKGPSKADTRTSGHNDVGWYFYRFGLVGLSFYLFLLWYGMKQAWLGLKRGALQEEGAIHLATLLVLVQWSVFVMAENIFKDSQMMAVNMFMMGLVSPFTVTAAAGHPLLQRPNRLVIMVRTLRRPAWRRPHGPSRIPRHGPGRYASLLLQQRHARTQQVIQHRHRLPESRH